jgi:hypothetical protein
MLTTAPRHEYIDIYFTSFFSAVERKNFKFRTRDTFKDHVFKSSARKKESTTLSGGVAGATLLLLNGLVNVQFSNDIFRSKHPHFLRKYASLAWKACSINSSHPGCSCSYNKIFRQKKVMNATSVNQTPVPHYMTSCRIRILCVRSFHARGKYQP